MSVWIDASTIIALDTIGEIDLLRRTMGGVAVTPKIADEVLTERASSSLRYAVGTWIKMVPVRGDSRRWRRLGLGEGEASLFLTPREDILVLDDRVARQLARAEGRPFTGLLGLLMEAVRAEVINRAQALEMLDRLAQSGFRMSLPLFRIVRENLE